MDLIEFLRVRLDEDEAAARAALSNGAMPEWEHDRGEAYVEDSQGWVIVGLFGDMAPALPHIARWDPARVLAEVAAKREILLRHVPEYGGSRCGQCFGGGWSDPPLALYPCDTLLALAQPYADHPDFARAWRVEQR